MGFLTSLVMIIAFVASLALPVVAVVGVVAYIRRTRLLQDGIGDGSPYSTVLDSLEQVHIRLDAMNGRLTSLEETIRLEYKTPRQVQEPEEDRRMLPGEGQIE